ncbi:MAG: DNA repair protein RadD [Marinobacter maritimus]
MVIARKKGRFWTISDKLFDLEQSQRDILL